MISALIAAEESGDQLSDTELRHLVTRLVFAGQDTTRNQLGCALATFVEHPEQWARLADAPRFAARAVKEACECGLRSQFPLGSPQRTSSSGACRFPPAPYSPC